MKPLPLATFHFLLVAATLPCFAQDSAKAEVERVYNAAKTATDQHDVATFERILTDDFVFIARYGEVFDRQTFLTRHKEGRMLTGIKNDLVGMRIYGDSAVVTERYAVASRSENLISTKLFVKQGGTWKWASFQATIVAPPSTSAPKK